MRGWKSPKGNNIATLFGVVTYIINQEPLEVVLEEVVVVVMLNEHQKPFAFLAIR